MANNRQSDQATPTIALTAERAAAALDLPYTTFADKVKRREIPYVLVGGGRHRQHRRFLPEDLRTWAMRHRVPARWEAEAAGEGAAQ